MLVDVGFDFKAPVNDILGGWALASDLLFHLIDHLLDVPWVLYMVYASEPWINEDILIVLQLPSINVFIYLQSVLLEVHGFPPILFIQFLLNLFFLGVNLVMMLAILRS